MAKEAGRQRLAVERTARRLTYDEYEDLTGIKRSTLSSIINGHDELNLRVAVVASNALGIELSDFLGLSKPKAPRTVGPDGQVDLDGAKGRVPVSIAVDMPELGLLAGDVLLIDTEGVPEMRKLVVVEDEHKLCRVYRVRAMSPMILERHAGPAAVFDDRYHRIRAVVVRLIRDDP